MTLDTRISLHKLELLCVVVEAGGITRAADRLFLTQPVVTAHINSLEKRLGVKLFERSGRGIEPTKAGEAVYIWAKELISRTREMSREIEGLASGSGGSAVIAAGMTAGTFVLPPILIDFYQANPSAHVTLTQQAPERAVESVSTGDADAAVVLGNDRLLDLPNLHHEHLRDEELILVAACTDNAPDVVTVAQLHELRFVCSPERGSLRRAVVEQKLASVGAGPRNIVLEVDHPTALKTCVRQAVGVAFMFRSSVNEELTAGTLRHITITDTSLSIPLFLVSRRDKRFTPLQRKLVDYIRTRLNPEATHSSEVTPERPVTKKEQAEDPGVLVNEAYS
jgi:DNA-binding transcriptional LysR family regulator